MRVCMCALPTRTSAYVIVLNKRKRWMLYDVRVGGREREREREGEREREREKKGDKTLLTSAFSKFYYVRRFTFKFFFRFVLSDDFSLLR